MLHQMVAVECIYATTKIKKKSWGEGTKRKEPKHRGRKKWIFATNAVAHITAEASRGILKVLYKCVLMKKY